MVCESVNGSLRSEVIDGVTYRRGGNRVTVHLRALWTVITSDYDLYVDDIAHAVPWFTPLLRSNVLGVLHHVHGDLLLGETGLILGSILRFLESTIPLFYRNTRFVVVSQSTASELCKLGIPEENITVIHNGIDLPDKAIPKTEHPQLIYFGRYKKYKGVEKILKIFKKIWLEIPDSSLVIAGKGTDHMELTALIDSYGLQDSVYQLGQVSDTEKNILLGSAWVNLVASDVEGWSITTIEAAHFGTPTIAFDVHGLRDSVIDGETGILVPYDDLDSYFTELYDLILDSSHLDRLSNNAKHHAHQFTWDSAAIKLASRIEDMEETN